MSTVHYTRTSLRCKRPRPSEMPVAMHYPRLTEPASCDELRQCHQANVVQVRSRVQVSLEDAEILMGTAERINIAGQPSCAPYMTCERRMSLKTGREVSTTSETRQLPLQLLSNHLDANELQRSASGPVSNPVPEHGVQLHKANSLPVGIDLPGQRTSPPVRVPKGIRSNRLRKQVSSPGGALAAKKGGQSPAKALGVKRAGGASRVIKTTSVVQEEFIKSFRPSPAQKGDGCSGMLLLLEACDALAANPLLADNQSPCPHPVTRGDDWASASPLTRGGRSEHKTRRVNLMEEGAYETAPTGNARRIRKPLDNDFLYYAQAGNSGSKMDCNGQTDCEGAQDAKGNGWGAEEGFWNPGGRRRGGRGELQGPCNHCFAEDSPQWRKGPRCKPVLCNACGTRFLRTRSLGKVRNTKSKAREVQQSRFAEPSLDDMMDEDGDMDCTVSNVLAWGGSVKNDSLTHEQDNVSSSTTVPGMGYGNVHHSCGGIAAMHHNNFDTREALMMPAQRHTVHEDCASAAVSQ